ncbi:hypothetical protein [Nostoc sp.]|uniref:hypothetical protein n=1 Tax=Nostoc sp. TaxID=1180 RepID=UPI002FF552F7
MPTEKTRNYLRYVNDGKEEDAIHRVSTRGDRKNDACGGLRLRIPILFTISVLLGAIASATVSPKITKAPGRIMIALVHNTSSFEFIVGSLGTMKLKVKYKS